MYSLLGVVGGGLIGLGLGCGGVAGFVLVSEAATTNKTKRYIESGIAAVALVVGMVLVFRSQAG